MMHNNFVKFSTDASARLSVFYLSPVWGAGAHGCPLGMGSVLLKASRPRTKSVSLLCHGRGTPVAEKSGCSQDQEKSVVLSDAESGIGRQSMGLPSHKTPTETKALRQICPQVEAGESRLAAMSVNKCKVAIQGGMDGWRTRPKRMRLATFLSVTQWSSIRTMDAHDLTAYSACVPSSHLLTPETITCSFENVQKDREAMCGQGIQGPPGPSARAGLRLRPFSRNSRTTRAVPLPHHVGLRPDHHDPEGW